MYTNVDSKRGGTMTDPRLTLTCLCDKIFTIIYVIKCFTLDGEKIIDFLFYKEKNNTSRLIDN